MVIFGSGTIGLTCGVVARHFGAKKIIAVDIDNSKLDFAKSFDRRATYLPPKDATPEENAHAIITQNNLDQGAHAVIEASGAESCINTAIHVLRPGGNYVQTGLGKAIVNFPILTLSEKELHVHGACRYGPGDYDVAMDVLDSKRVDVGKLISKVWEFEETTEAWEATRMGRGIKNLIRVGGG